MRADQLAAAGGMEAGSSSPGNPAWRRARAMQAALMTSEMNARRN